MVIVCRVDERLLHGQVSVTWISDLQPDSILVANDDVVQNEIAKMAIKMVKPQGVAMAIRSVEEGAQILNDPRTKKLKIFVLVKTIEDALRLVEKTSTIHHVNIGGVKKKEGSRLIAPAVYLNEEDLEPLRQLCHVVKTVEFRMIPSEAGRNARDIIHF